MKKKQASRTTPTNGETTQTNSFAWSPGPTIFEYSSETHERTLIAKQMRKALRKSLPELAGMLGYSPAQVLAFERGYDKDGKALPEKKWRRYLWALIGASYGEEKWQGSQSNARIQAWLIAQGYGEARQKGRQGHRPKASDRHRFERSSKGWWPNKW
jgi:transcriptional regulator with XRE-family HTH domain